MCNYFLVFKVQALQQLHFVSGIKKITDTCIHSGNIALYAKPLLTKSWLQFCQPKLTSQQQLLNTRMNEFIHNLNIIT